MKIPLTALMAVFAASAYSQSTPYIEQDRSAGGLTWNPDPGHFRGEMIQGFTGAGLPPVMEVHHISWKWTFTGCDPTPSIIEYTTGDPQVPDVIVTFITPGKCTVTFWVKDLNDPLYEYNLTADYYVFGGRFDVSVANAPSSYWQHYDRNNRNAWYLNFFGWNPSTSSKPAYAQDPVYATLIAAPGQPANTEYWWSFPASKVGLVAPYDDNESSAASTIKLAAVAGSGSRGDIILDLTFRLPVQQLDGSWYTFTINDYATAGRIQGEKYRKFTSHVPTTVTSPHPQDSSHQHVDHLTSNPYSCIGEYWYRVRDQLSVYVPKLNVQERFPNGVANGFEINPDGTGWQTLDGPIPDIAPYSLGLFGADYLKSGDQQAPWTFQAHPTQPLWGPYVHEYWVALLRHRQGVRVGSFAEHS